MIPVEVAPNPTASFSVSDIGLDCSFIDNSNGAIVSHVWDFGDGATSSLQQPQHTYAQPGTYTVTLTVTTSAGCTSTTSQTITLSLSGIGSLLQDGTSVVGGSQQVVFNRPSSADVPMTVDIYDVAGRRLVAATQLPSGRSVVPVVTGSSAIVLVHLSTSTGETRIKVLVTE
jgi:PKD repeat protein